MTKTDIASGQPSPAAAKTPAVAPAVLSPAQQAEYNRDKNLSVLAFVMRCTIAGVLAYMIPKAFGFESAVWASMAAVHVAREPLTKTHKEVFQRVWGTVVGSAIGIGVMVLAEVVPMAMPIQIGLAIIISSSISAFYPLLHISMWICLAVMLKSTHDMSPLGVGLTRTGEVIFGALVAVVVHRITVEIVRYIRAKRGVKVAQDIADED